MGVVAEREGRDSWWCGGGIGWLTQSILLFVVVFPTPCDLEELGIIDDIFAHQGLVHLGFSLHFMDSCQAYVVAVLIHPGNVFLGQLVHHC